MSSANRNTRGKTKNNLRMPNSLYHDNKMKNNVFMMEELRIY